MTLTIVKRFSFYFVLLVYTNFIDLQIKICHNFRNFQMCLHFNVVFDLDFNLVWSERHCWVMCRRETRLAYAYQTIFLVSLISVFVTEHIIGFLLNISTWGKLNFCHRLDTFTTRIGWLFDERRKGIFIQMYFLYL